MDKIKRKSFKINALEKRLMLDASLGTTLSSTVVFGEDTAQAGPNILDTDGVTVTGSTTDFDGRSLDISTDGGADDQLDINNEGTGAGQIGFDGTNVTYEGVLIGTISSDGSNGSNLTIDFNANANKAAIERLIENITYQNNSDDPVQDRAITFDIDGEFASPYSMTVTVVGQNDDPTIDTNTGMTVNEGSTTTITSAMLGISDPDNTDTEITITITSAVSNGRIELSTNAGVAISDFTLDDLNSGIVRYVHDSSETITDSFDFQVDDGTVTLATDTFDITINAVDDPLVLNTNTGTDLSRGQEVGIGGREVPEQFGNHLRTIGEGNNMSAFNGLINGTNDTQMRIIITTDSVNANGVPGDVIFETGGSGRGVALVLDGNNRLAWYSGPATATPRMLSPISLAHDTQYAIIMEIDDTNNQIRMHYEAAGDFNWYEFGRTAEASIAWTDQNVSGSNGTGVGNVNSSIGGYNAARSNNFFEGSIDSDLIITRFPTGGTTILNDQLIFTDPDTTTANIVYTVTTDVQFGTLRNNGVDIGLGDTFTQADLDTGLITYQHDSSLNALDNFEFSVTDGTTVIAAQNYNITIDVVNDAPVLDVQPLSVAEDAVNGSSIGTITANDPDPGQDLTYTIQGGTGAGIFAIDSSTGQVTVADNSTLDFETTTSYTLIVRATDDFSVPDFDEQTFTINVQDVYEGVAPNFTFSGPFNIDENSANNDDVGTVTAADGDGDNITFSIVGGNTNNAFSINGTTGLIEVNGDNKLDFETRSFYNLTVRATDDSVINEFTNITVRIDINDLNEGPTLEVGEVIEGANTTVRYSTDTGNFYEYRNQNTNFNNAINQAALRMLNGQGGHLVTITSAAENAFVDSIIGNHVWIAASDSLNEGEWLWVDGPEAGTQFSQGGTAVNGLYENWNGTEPNNAASDTAYLHTNGRWYDQNGGNRRYVVEWDNSNYQIINNTEYTIAHDNADASDVALNYSVGFMQSYDDDGDTLEYTIQAGNGDSIFDIDINTGEITIADKTNLDASVNDSFTLTIRVQEQGGGLWAEKDIVINFDQRFTVAQNNAINVDENGTTVIDNTDLQVLDNDTAATDLIYTVTTSPTNGQLELTTGAGVAITTFTQDDIDNNRLVFAHDGSETLSDSFEFTITDGTETLTNQTFNITVDPINQGPTVSVNTGTTVVEGGSATINNTMLAATDQDDVDSTLAYTASNLSNGHIEVNGAINNNFTQADLDAGLVEFIHDGTEGDGSFDFSIADGGEDLASPATGTFTLTKTDVNDAPLITTNTGTTVLEGGDTTITTAMLNVTDPDDSGTGLTYTLSNIQNGTVRLSTNPGVPVIDFTQDDLDNGRVFFRHDGNEGDAQFDVTVEDGGENSAGTDTATFNLTKIDVNDAPTILNNAGSSINQNSILVLNPFVLSAADTDDAPSGIFFTVDATTNGHVEFVANPNVAITNFTQADINAGLVAFRHSGPPTTASFDFTIEDGREDGAGTTSSTFNMNVDNTNDAPVISVNVTPTIDEAATLNITTAILDSFDPDDFGADLTWTASNLSNGTIYVNGVALNTWTQADLAAGLVTFIHDGSETLTASFDIEVADGGEDLVAPATGTFNMNITPINEGPTLVVNDGDPDIIDFNDYTIDPYSGGQDDTGTVTVTPDGTEVNITGNSWKEISVTKTLTANTVLSFEVNASDVGELLAIGFDADSDYNNGNFIYQIGGSDVFGGFNQGFNTYELGDGWVRFDIPIGNDYTGVISELVFVVDDDANDSGDATFRNVNFYEDNVVVDMNEGGTLLITNALLTTIDPDDSGTGLSYTATNLTNGHIEVNGVITNNFTQDDIDNNLVEFIHDGTETLTAGFDIEVADGGENGTTSDSDRFDIIVNAVDEAPLVATNNGMLTATEGGTTTLTAAMLTTSDSDTAPRNVVFDVTGALSNGQLELSTNAGVAITSFTLADIQNGIVRYVHNGSETIADSFNFTVSDGTTTLAADTFNITVAAVNDAPVVTGDLAIAMAEGATATITTADLGFTDPDDISTGVTFSVSNESNGHIEVGGIVQATFTAQNIIDGIVRFVHDGTESAAAGFDFTLTDGDATTASQSFDITVTPVNDAPVITGDLAITMDEGTTATITAADLGFTDPDNIATGVTYTVSNLSNGVVQVNGVNNSSFTAQDILDGVVTFVHNDSQTTTAGFDISLSDGALNDTATMNITVNAINDASILATNTGANITESGTTTITNAMLDTTDVDDTPAGITYTITDTTNGWVELTTNTGFPVDSFTQDDIDNNRVVFRHDGSGANAASFDFSVRDGGEDSASATTGTFNLNVNTAINEAPVIAISDGTPTTVDFSSSVITPYGAGDFGDGQGGTDTDFDVSSDGTVLTLYGNAWKKIPMPITLTANTVLTFDFRATSEGELHEIGFDTDDSVSSGRSAFQLTGSDVSTGIQTYNSYSIGDGWTRFEIPVGDDFTGAVNYLFFAADDDAGVEGLSQFRNVSIYEADPTVSVAEGGSVTITNANLNTFDTDDAPGDLTYTASNYSNGHIEVNGVTQNTFTQDDINNNLVVFVHDDSETTTASFDISVSDGSLNDTATFNLNVTPVNEAPTITGDLTMAVNEDASVTITPADLGFTDFDDIATGVTYTVSNLSNGHIEVGGNPQNTFTAQDVINGDVDFIHDGSETTTAGFDISLADGGEDAAAPDTASMSITVTPVNDTPTNITLSATSVHESENTGVLIGTLSTSDVDLPSDTFTYSIVNDPDNKFILVGNELRLNNLVDYELDTQHDVRIQTDDNNGGVFDRLFTINILDNTAPTDIEIDNTEIQENSVNGEIIGTLSAIDSDPNEVMTYTIIDNPGNMFAINGNDLVVGGAIDFESFREAEVMIRVQDIDGNTFDRMILVSIQDVAEFSGDIVTLDTNVFDAIESNNNRRGFGFNGIDKRDIFRVGDIIDPLISFDRPGVIGATLNGEQFRAFYGENLQIIRENTTFIVQDLVNSEGNIVIPNALVEQLPTTAPTIQDFFGADANTEQQQNSEFEQPQDKLRATLLKLQELAEGNEGTLPVSDFALLDKDFKDVLTYHEQKKAALREALLKS